MTLYDARSASPLLDLLFEDDAVGRCLVAPDGSVLRANREWLRSTGFSLDHVLGANLIDLFPETRDVALAMYARARGGHRVEVPRHAQVANGRECWWEGSIDPVPMEGGTGLLIVAREVSEGGVARGRQRASDADTQVTDRLRAEAALRKGDEGYRWVLDGMKEGFALHELILDADGNPADYRFLMVNPAFERLTGLAAAQVRGRTVREVIPEIEPTWIERYGRVVLTGEPATFESYSAALGRWYEVRATRVGERRFSVLFLDTTERKRLDSEFRESQQKFAAIFSNAPVGIALVRHRDGVLVEMNPEWNRLTGWAREDAIGRSNADLKIFVDATALRRAFEGRGEPGSTRRLDAEIVSRTGERRWIAGTATFVELAGELHRLVVAHDVTDRTRAEQALRQSEERFRVLIENLHSGVALVDERGAFALVNQAFRRMFEIPEDADILNVNNRDWARWQVLDEHGVLLPVDEHPVRKAALAGRAVKNQLVAVKSPTRTDPLWLLVSAEPVLGARGAVQYLVCTYYDVTMHRTAEEAVRRSEHRLRALGDNLPDGAVYRYRHEADGRPRFEYISRGIEAMTGVSPEEIVRDAAALHGLFLSEDRERLAQEERRSRDTGSVFELEVRERHRATGETRWALLRSVPERQPDGVTVWDGIHIDITARKRAEEALRESEERLRVALDAASLGTFDFDPSTGKATWDAQIRRIWGVSPQEEMDLERVLARVHPEDRDRVSALFASALSPKSDGRYQAEYRIVWPDGAVRWCSASGRVYFAGEGAERRPVRVAGVEADITERKRALESLVESEARTRRLLAELQTVLDAVPAAVFITRDPEARRIDANRAGLDLLQMAPGTNVSKSAPAPEAPTYRILRGGHEVPAEEMPSQRAARGVEVRDWDCEVRFQDGGSRHILGYATPLRDPAGAPSGSVTAFVDITERKRAERELEAANTQLREADRRKNEFLAVLSHELRNPLAPIRSSIFLLGHAAPGSEPFVRARETIERQTEHLTRLVDDLLDVVRITRGRVELRRERVDLRDLVRKAMDDLRPTFAQAGVELRVEHALGSTWLDADRTRIAQVIGNLLHNAQKFTPRGGVVTVSLSVNGGEVDLRVKDTGVGMEPGREHEMFEAFAQGDQGLARTKGGLGLGLSLVKLFVEMHGGTVTARSEGKGHGTEFVVTLPLAATEAPETRHGEGPDAPARRVLVIEDNADAAQTLADLLALCGHVVRVANSGGEGIALAREQRPDVILCDVGLPDIDGYEVARTLRGVPGLEGVRLIALTGYAQVEDRERALQAGFDDHVAKPPDPKVLDVLLRVRP